MTNGNAQPTAHPAPPCIMVIFGASGDLTKRKLLPALLNLAEEGLLPKEFAIVGFSFDQMTTEALREKLGKEVREYALRPVDDILWQWLVERIYYVQGDFGDPAAYQRLKDQIARRGKRTQHPRQPLSLSRCRAEIFLADRQKTWRSRANATGKRPLDARHRRKAIRPRP